MGTVLTLPVPFGIPRKDCLRLFGDRLAEFAAKVKPELVFISAGFDTHREDPVGNLGLETEDFGVLTRTELDVAQAYAGGRVISVLEGGYHPERMADCVEIRLAEMVPRAGQ